MPPRKRQRQTTKKTKQPDVASSAPTTPDQYAAIAKGGSAICGITSQAVELILALPTPLTRIDVFTIILKTIEASSVTVVTTLKEGINYQSLTALVKESTGVTATKLNLSPEDKDELLISTIATVATAVNTVFA